MPFSQVSIFDQLLRSNPTANDEFQTGPSPLNATKYIRRLVLAQAIFLVRHALFEVNKLTLEAAVDTKRIGEFSMRDIQETGWSGEWKGKFYTRIWELRENLQHTGQMLKQTHKTIERINKIESWRKDKRPKDAAGSTEPETDLYKYGIEENECDGWEWEDVQSSVEFGLQMLDRTRDTYVEAVGATAAKLANDQAIRQVPDGAYMPNLRPRANMQCKLYGNSSRQISG